MARKNTAQPVETVEVVDPAEVVIGANIRTEDLTLDEAFVESVRAHGVVVPVTAYRDQGGQIVVVDGQMRTLAAVEAGVRQMRAIVGESREDAQRVVEQWTANEMRQAMTDGDRFGAIQELLSVNVSAEQVAASLRVDAEQVEAVQTATEHGVTKEKVSAAAGWDLTALALLAEVEAEHGPEAAEQIKNRAWGSTREAIERAARQWQADQRDAALIEQARQEWAAAGVTLGEQPTYDDRRPEPGDLTTRDGKPLPEDVHVLAHLPGVELHPVLGWESEQDEDGNHTSVRVVQIGARVNEAAKNGYMRKVVGEKGETVDAEAAREQRRAAKARRDEWAAAEQPRREHIAGLLTSKTPPTGHENIVLTWIASGVRPTLGAVARVYPGVDAAKVRREIDSPRTSAKRRQVIAAAVALMQWDSGLSIHTLKNPTGLDRAMMRALIKTGYAASKTERDL